MIRPVHICAVLTLFAYPVGQLWSGPPSGEEDAGYKFARESYPHGLATILDSRRGANLETELKQHGEQSGLRASEFGIGLMLLEHDEVREELRLSSRTMVRVAELRRQLQQELSEAFDKRDEAVACGAAPGILERFLRQANEGKRAELRELLTDDQARRLRQLVLQFRSVQALHDDQVAGALGLTADQRKQLAELQAQYERRLTPIVERMMGEPFDGEADGRRQFRRLALSLHAEYAPRYGKVLTESQREQFRQMQGEPLAFPDRPPGLEEQVGPCMNAPQSSERSQR